MEKAASALWNIARHGDESRRDEVVATEHALDSLLSAMQLGCYPAAAVISQLTERQAGTSGSAEWRREEAVKAGALDAIVNVLRQETSCVLTSGRASSALKNFAANGYEDEVVAAGALEPLVERLKAMHDNEDYATPAAIALASLARRSEKCAAAVFQAGAIEPLASLLSTADVFGKASAVATKASAASALADLVFANETRRKAVQSLPGTIDALRALARDEDLRVSAPAVIALMHLTGRNSKEMATWFHEMKADGKLGELVAEMRHNEDDCCELALNVLNAGTADEHKDTVIAAGVLDPLVTLLRDGKTSMIKTKAAMLLSSLSHGKGDVRARRETIIGAGALDAILAVLSNGSVKGKVFAARALGNLAYRQDELVGAQWANLSAAIKALVTLLSNGNAMGKVDAARTLAYISHLGEEETRLNSIVEAGVLPPLVTIMKDESATRDALFYASMLVARIAYKNEERTEAVLDGGAAGALVSIISRTETANVNANVKLQASRAIACIASSPSVKHREALILTGAVRPLEDMVNGSCERASKNASYAMHRLSSRERARWIRAHSPRKK